MNSIEVDHLTKKFGDLVAVNDISFNVAQQEIFGLLGPNGAGHLRRQLRERRASPGTIFETTRMVFVSPWA